VSEEFIVKVPLADIYTCLFMRSVSIFFFFGYPGLEIIDNLIDRDVEKY